MSNRVSYDEVLKTIAENYKEIEHSIANQLLINVPNHQPTTGSYRESVWKSLFEMVIPKKYCIEQGVFIIDSYGFKSKEVDLAIFDEVYTPYIFNYGTIKFIPVEAVVAVVQCKSAKVNSTVKSDEGNVENVIINWVKSINNLTTSLDSVARTATSMADNKNITNRIKLTQTATRPLKILCCLAKKEKLKKFEQEFDILLTVEDYKLHKIVPGLEQSLYQWNDMLNHAIGEIEDKEDKKYRERIKKDRDTDAVERKALLNDLTVRQPAEKGEVEENVILSLIFQLNQLLIILNNPMFFPHRAYARQFSNILNTATKSKGEQQDGQKKK